MTDPRLQWILDRLAEDEATARAAAEPWQLALRYCADLGNVVGDDGLKYAATWHPARALAVVAAARQILEEHRPDAEPPYSVSCVTCTDKTGGIWKEQWCNEPWPCPTVRAIASIWADNDQYREMWCGESGGT